MDSDFVAEYPPVVGVSIILSLCDVMMVQFVPMRKSTFFDKSKGFATMPMMKFCLVLKTAQSLVSVICQIAYLVSNNDDLQNPTASTEAKALFIMNILTAFVGVVMGVILLCLKQKFLREDDKEQQNAENGASLELNMTDVYTENPSILGNVESMANPMHRTAPAGGVTSSGAGVEASLWGHCAANSGTGAK